MFCFAIAVWLQVLGAVYQVGADPEVHTTMELAEEDSPPRYIHCQGDTAEGFVYGIDLTEPGTRYSNIHFELKNVSISNAYIIRELQDLSSSARLINITISNNLTDFEVEYLISSIQNVQVLNVGHNNLTRLPPVSSNRGLQYLYVNDNTINRIYANYDLKELKGLDLKHCNISYIHKKAFDVDGDINYNLKVLNLSQNRIKTLNSALKKLCGLDVLDLNSNLIESVDANEFCQVSFIDIRNNNIFKTDFDLNLRYPISKISLDVNSWGNIDNASMSVVMESERYFNKTNINELAVNSDVDFLPRNTFNQPDQYFYTYGSSFRLNNVSLSKISDNAFNDLRYAHVLEIKSSHLTILENYVFNNSIFSVVDLSHSSIWTIDANAFHGSLVEILILTDNQLTVINPNIFCNTGLSELDISYNKIKIFKTLGCENDIKTIHLQFNLLDSINNFGILSELKHLNVSNNKIIRLEEGFASSFRHLEILDLSNNQLKAINEKTFEPLKKLRFLSLEGNNIAKIHPEAFAYDAFDLSTLILSYNGVFEAEMLSRLCHLANLTLTRSAITLLKERSFIGLVRLQRITLIDVTVKNIEAGCFGGLAHLIEGDFANILSEQEQLENGVFWGLWSLETLNVSYTNLRLIHQNSFEGAGNLQTLILSHNNIEHLDIGCFTGLDHLRSLYLNHNALKKIDVGVFSGLGKLEILDLSGNHIQVLDHYLLYPVLRNLRQLDLSENKLMELDHVSLIQVQKNLQTINISDNLWKCQYLAKLLGNLTVHQIDYKSDNLVYHAENIDGIYCIDTCKFLYCNNLPPEEPLN